MKEGPWTVTADRPVGVTPDPDPHDYYSEAPYWWPNPDNPAGPFIRKDGQPTPTASSPIRPLSTRCATPSSP